MPRNNNSARVLLLPNIKYANHVIVKVDLVILEMCCMCCIIGLHQTYTVAYNKQRL